jgi:hypothetical protein
LVRKKAVDAPDMPLPTMQMSSAVAMAAWREGSRRRTTGRRRKGGIEKVNAF